ncbi:MAG: peptidylprolyl isomerase [Anaerolineales bacterium]|nr:peptidylprolyl isomerase [Anaerolineales bacterium]
MFSHSRHILFRLLLLLALSLSACASFTETPATATPALPTQTPIPPTPTPPPLAAIVNDEWITEEEFLAEVDRYRAAQGALENEVTADDVAQIVLDDLIAQALLAQAARADGFEITEADLKSRLDALASDVGGVDALAAWQSEHGYTDDSFQFALKRAAEAAWMRDKIITAVPGTAEQVHARQILLYNEDTARKVADQLDAGASFADLAVLYDPNTGGELGWFPRGYLLEPELEEAAFSLEPEQYSDVIASEVGYHILLVVERDAQHPLSPDAYLVMQEKALSDWLVQKRTESDIVLAP